MITDEEIDQFLQRPSLVERASAAAQKAKDAADAQREADRRYGFDKLYGELQYILRDILELTPGEIEDVETKEDAFKDRPMLVFHIEALSFRGYWAEGVQATYNVNGSPETVRGWDTLWEVRRNDTSGSSWRRFKSIEDIGAMFVGPILPPLDYS
jgi:hypothetical protein